MNKLGKFLNSTCSVDAENGLTFCSTYKIDLLIVWNVKESTFKIHKVYKIFISIRKQIIRYIWKFLKEISFKLLKRTYIGLQYASWQKNWTYQAPWLQLSVETFPKLHFCTSCLCYYFPSWPFISNVQYCISSLGFSTN